MSTPEREDPILAPSGMLEYLVHGNWMPTEGHINGRYGAWWVDLHYMLQSGLQEQDLNNKLDQYEQSQKATRTEAMAEAKARLEDEREDQQDT